MPDIVSSPKLNECGLQKLLLLFESADSNISGYCCVAFLTHCQLGMVIYYRLTLVVLTANAVFCKAHWWQFRPYLYYRRIGGRGRH